MYSKTLRKMLLKIKLKYTTIDSMVMPVLYCQCVKYF